MRKGFNFIFALVVFWNLEAVPGVVAQDAKPRPAFAPPTPPVTSPEVGGDREVTFRLRTASGNAVRLESSDFQAPERGIMKKGDLAVWSLTVGPLPPGAYRYHFTVDGLRVLDPVNPHASESNSNSWSLVVVPGSEALDTREVLHGAVSQVTYYSTTLKRHRRMHVYTPPGYGVSTEKYPVFYLLHGATDSDASWSTVGRAGFILDNLLANGRAVPMIVVMPNGHTGPFRFDGRNSLDKQVSEFVTEFTKDIRPYIEQHYRVRPGRAHRAIAGLSMGGAQTLEIAMNQLADYSSIGVFSSGVFSINPRGPIPPGPSWEEKYRSSLDDPRLKQGLERIWFAIGKEDFLLGTSRGTVKMLRGHGFKVAEKETTGGHTWLNWRDYLGEFTSLLFHETPSRKVAPQP